MAGVQRCCGGRRKRVVASKKKKSEPALRLDDHKTDLTCCLEGEGKRRCSFRSEGRVEELLTIEKKKQLSKDVSGSGSPLERGGGGVLARVGLEWGGTTKHGVSAASLWKDNSKNTNPHLWGGEKTLSGGKQAEETLGKKRKLFR